MTLSLTDWLTHSLTLTFAMQRIILETCGHWGIWSEWWGDMVFLWLWSLLSTFCILIILMQILTIWKIVLETFETSITILTIENLNSISHCYLTINCDTGQHSQFLWCFKSGNVKSYSFQNCDWTFQSCDCELRLNIIKRLWLNCDEYLDQNLS